MVALSPSAVSVLREHKEKQKLEQAMLGIPLKDDDLVFANEKGKPVDPSTLTHNFGRIVKRAGLNARFHDLRHSYSLSDVSGWRSS